MTATSPPKIATALTIAAIVCSVALTVAVVLKDKREHRYERTAKEATIRMLADLDANASQMEDAAARVQSIAYFDLLGNCMLSENWMGTSRLDKAITAQLQEQPLRGDVNQDVVRVTIENVELNCNTELLRNIAAMNPNGALALAPILLEQGLNVPKAYQSSAVQMAALESLVLPRPENRL